MAEEQLNLVDGMSPSLKRIYQEAERLNKRILTLRSNIQALEKPTSMSYLKRELKSVEQQAQNTQKALKRAVEVGTKEGVLSWNARYRGTQHHMMYGQKQYIKDADLVRYGNYIQNAQLRRNRLLWDQGRLVNGLTFDQRLALRNRPSFLSNFASGTSTALTNMQSGLIQTGIKLYLFAQSVSAAVDAIKGIVKSQDEMVSIKTRVALTNATGMSTAQLTDQVFGIANRTRADILGSASLYNRIATSGVNATNERILRFVETFNKSMVISGTSAQENRAVMLQLAQGMGSNRLGGDEFRSIAEQAPIFKYMLAKGMGVNPGALKQMGAEGKLTADAIMTAMEKTQDLVDRIFVKMPWTIGQLGTVFKNKFLQITDQNLHAYTVLRTEFMKLIKWMDSKQGMEFFTSLFQVINSVTVAFVQFTKMIMPAVIWLLKHMKFIIVSLTAIYTTMKMIALAQWFAKASTQAGILGTTIKNVQLEMKGIAITLSPVIGIVTGIAGAIMTVVGALWAFKHINDELNPDKIRQDRQHKDARFIYEREVDNYIKNQIGPKPTYLSAPGKQVKLTPEQQKEQDAWNREYLKLQNQKKMVMYQWDEAAKEGTFLKFTKEDIDPYSALRGMLDPTKNVPMNVNKVNEVGKINDDINLSTDSIQMMKAIAERQWVVQNEVIVPQKVEMTVDKSTNVDPESLAQKFNEGVQIAVASTMRGEAA